MLCLYPECNNTSRTRGLCHGHYQTMRDRVRKGRAEEADLMRRGLLLAKGTGGSPVTDHAAFERGSEILGRAPGIFRPCTRCGTATRYQREGRAVCGSC